MALSAEFSVNGDATVSEHTCAYGSTVALAALSTEFRTIAWEITSSSKSGTVTPTITLAGAPLGVTASFPQVADPGDGLGRTWVVKCTQTNAEGNESVAYRVVGTLNTGSRLPVCADEAAYRNTTHGWTEVFNSVLAAVGGIGSGDVIGPAGATSGNLPQFSSGTGKALSDSGIPTTNVELARRPLSAYATTANTAVLADALKFITTSNGSANTFTIPPQASVAWLTESLLLGANIGAGTMTLTAGAGVTLHGSVTVATNGWWWAKRTALNTWQVFVGGTGGGVTAHSALTGLSADDHTQYSLVDGTRAFTGGVTVTQAAAAASTPVALRVTGGAHTTAVASAELVDVDFSLGRTVQFATGSVTTQRAGLFRAPTYGFVGASVITDAATLAVTGAPNAGANATITNAYAFWVQAGAVRFGGLGAGVVHASATGLLTSSLLVTADVTDASITLAKIQNASAQGKFLLRKSASAGPFEEGVLHDGIETDATGGKLSDTIPARGTKNTAVDLVPSGQAGTTIANSGTATMDIAITSGKWAIVTFAVRCHASNVVKYVKTLQVYAQNVAGTVAIDSQSTLNELLLEGAVWTLVATASSGNVRATLTNSSGSTRTYSWIGGKIEADL